MSEMGVNVISHLVLVTQVCEKEIERINKKQLPKRF